LFPFARQIIADAVINTGFPPLLLDPIDFAAAYIAQMQAAQQGGEQPAVEDSSTKAEGEEAPAEEPAADEPSKS
jgi:preprotein translocase subunit SecB